MTAEGGLSEKWGSQFGQIEWGTGGVLSQGEWNGVAEIH